MLLRDLKDTVENRMTWEKLMTLAPSSAQAYAPQIGWAGNRNSELRKRGARESSEASVRLQSWEPQSYCSVCCFF